MHKHTIYVDNDKGKIDLKGFLSRLGFTQKKGVYIPKSFSQIIEIRDKSSRIDFTLNRYVLEILIPQTKGASIPHAVENFEEFEKILNKMRSVQFRIE